MVQPELKPLLLVRLCLQGMRLSKCSIYIHLLKQLDITTVSIILTRCCVFTLDLLLHFVCQTIMREETLVSIHFCVIT
jgi:hypothetical protein